MPAKPKLLHDRLISKRADTGWNTILPPYSRLGRATRSYIVINLCVHIDELCPGYHRRRLRAVSEPLGEAVT